MPSTTTTIAPPPTTNRLDAMQRARVMRYSRKLGAVLGTTPFLLESCGSTVPATLYPASRHNSTRSHTKRLHHRQRSDFDDQPRASTESSPLPFSRAASSSKDSLLSMSDSSVESDVPLVFATKSHRPHATPRPLIFLDTVPLSSSDTRVQATPRLTCSSSLDALPTPTTPKQLNTAEARRRKMARVMRTFGEKVPPELVFQDSDKYDLENDPVSTTMLLDARPVSRTRSTSSSTSSHRRRSASVGSSSSTQWHRLLELPAPVFSSGAKAPDDQRWVGEWNRRNIGQVQRELRALRN